ncbi:Unknown protein, partial [Striga hermonthica]
PNVQLLEAAVLASKALLPFLQDMILVIIYPVSPTCHSFHIFTALKYELKQIITKLFHFHRLLQSPYVIRSSFNSNPASSSPSFQYITLTICLEHPLSRFHFPSSKVLRDNTEAKQLKEFFATHTCRILENFLGEFTARTFTGIPERLQLTTLPEQRSCCIYSIGSDVTSYST